MLSDENYKIMKQNFWTEVNEIFRSNREAMGLTREEVSDITNVPVLIIKQIEEGKYIRVYEAFVLARLYRKQLRLELD